MRIGFIFGVLLLIFLVGYSNCTDIRVVAPTTSSSEGPPAEAGASPPAPLVNKVEALWGTTVAVRQGVLYRWGSQYLPHIVVPELVKDAAGAPIGNLLQLSASAFNVCFFQTDQAQCYGHNFYKQIENTTAQWVDAPKVMMGGRALNQMMPSYGHMCGVLKNKSVECWGLNNSAQVGVATTAGTIVTPSAISLSGVEEISSDYYHSCARVQLGEVRCWGANNFKQLGNSQVTSITSPPVAVIGSDNQPLRGVSQLALNTSASCALRQGQVYCWGAIGIDAFGTSIISAVPTLMTGATKAISKIAAGGSSLCAITVSGKLLCWGNNSDGQVGVGSIEHRVTEPTQVVGMSSGVTDVSIGINHACAIKNDKIWCWGNNNQGQLGNGFLNPTNVPIEPFFP